MRAGKGTRRSRSPTPRRLPPRRRALTGVLPPPWTSHRLQSGTPCRTSRTQTGPPCNGTGGGQSSAQTPNHAPPSSPYPPGGHPWEQAAPSPPSSPAGTPAGTQPPRGTWKACRPWGCTRRRPACRPRTGCWRSPGGTCHLQAEAVGGQGRDGGECPALTDSRGRGKGGGGTAHVPPPLPAPRGCPARLGKGRGHRCWWESGSRECSEAAAGGVGGGLAGL